MPPTDMPAIFAGSALRDLKKFPKQVMNIAGVQISHVQKGLRPTDWKPIKSVGPGVIEIRIQEDSEAFRVFYVVKNGCVYILHAFHKKTQKTEKREKDLAKARLKEIAP